MLYGAHKSGEPEGALTQKWRETYNKVDEKNQNRGEVLNGRLLLVFSHVRRVTKAAA